MSIDTEKREFETKAVYFFKQIQIKNLVIAVVIGTYLTHSLSSVDERMEVISKNAKMMDLGSPLNIYS